MGRAPQNDLIGIFIEKNSINDFLLTRIAKPGMWD